MLSYLDEIKETELNILVYIANICEQNNIRYYLMYGTLLGAVRHKGFIPWDDDIDISIPRKDYEKLKQILKNENNRIYTLVSWEHDKDYPYIFPKVIDTRTKLRERAFRHLNFQYGVYIDIFVMDGLPEDKLTRVLMEKRHKFLYQLIRYYYRNELDLNSMLRIIQPFYKRIINIESVKKKIDEMYLNYDFDESKLCRIQLGFTPDAYLRTEYFKDISKKEFEGIMFNCPIDAHGCLVSEYDESYMELPSIEDRVSNHNFIEVEINGIKYEVNNK